LASNPGAPPTILVFKIADSDSTNFEFKIGVSGRYLESPVHSRITISGGTTATVGCAVGEAAKELRR